MSETRANVMTCFIICTMFVALGQCISSCLNTNDALPCHQCKTACNTRDSHVAACGDGVCKCETTTIVRVKE